MLEKINKFKNLIENSKNILLINHIRMDPDAFWSLWAFYLIMKKYWKNVRAINDENMPESFNFLWADNIIEKNLDIKSYNPDLIISFDAASIWQLWETYKNNKEIFDKNDFVVIDHHMTNEGFWNLNIIDSKMSSTCELLFYILEKIDLVKYIEKKEATLLTAWIHTDTNIFYNSNTNSSTLITAAKLMDLWADFRAPMYNFFQKSSYEKLKLTWLIFQSLKRSNNWKIIWVKITKDFFEKTNSSDEDVSWVINRMINVDWCEVAFILYETWDLVKASFRSKEYSVWDLCASFPNWWWHKLAAWFRSEKDINTVEKEIIDKIKL